jgi:hypothetical protein
MKSKKVNTHLRLKSTDAIASGVGNQVCGFEAQVRVDLRRRCAWT